MNKTISIAVMVVLGMTGQIARADFMFGTPTNLGSPVNTASHDAIASISADGLTLWLDSNRSGGYGQFDIWMATRATPSDSWNAPQHVGSPVNTGSWDGAPCISADGLTLYFSSDRPGGQGDVDNWMVTREAVDGPWGNPVNLGPTVNSAAPDAIPSVTADSLSLFFGSARPGGSGGLDIWMAARATTDDAWGAPVNLGPTVNSSSEDYPTISADGRTLFITSQRSGGYGGRDIWISKRGSVADPWSAPVNLGTPVNSSAWDQEPIISRDGSTLYFNSWRAGGGLDIYELSIYPIVDFNGDGEVDGLEVRKMVNQWGTDDSSCDIGPTPFGDGVVDVRDLIVLAEYLGRPVDDTTLVAHWAFDETEGITAHDRVRDNHGMVMGLPGWQPQSGAVEGALEFNGTTFVAVNTVVSPADGPFSVLAWVKGGAPGQTILAQGRSGWLMADVAYGRLATELQVVGRGPSGGQLCSPMVITDDAWHRVGCTWDGANRRLYVDEVLVAEDAQDKLAAATERLIIGGGKTMAPGTFWTGLIDDVRIYSRAVRP